MKMLYEDVITRMVESSRLGIGERVSAVTKMGQSVSEGEVVSATAGLVTLREGDGRVTTYQSRFYSFIPVEIDEAIPVPQNPQKKILDGTDVPQDPSQAAAEKENAKATKSSGQPERKVIQVTKKKEEKSDSVSASGVDVKKLPDDIRQHMDRIDQLDPVLVDRIVGAVGDAVVSELRTEKIQQETIYETVLQSQRAVREILTKTKIPIKVEVSKE